MSTEWSLKLKFKLTAHTQASWCNIIKIGIPDRATTVSPSFHIASGKLVTYDPRDVTYEMDVQLNKEYAFEVHQRYKSGGVYKYSIVLDGVEIHSKDTNNVQQFYGFTVFGANLTHDACIGTISEFTFTNFL